MGKHKFSFSQRHGHTPVPRRLRLKELPEDSRTAIWNVFCTYVQIPNQYASLMMPRHVSPWMRIVMHVHEQLFHERVDTFQLEQVWNRMDHVVNRGEFWEVFDLIETVLRHPSCPEPFVMIMANAFQESQLAYVISRANAPTIIPVANASSSDAILEALEEMKRSNLASGIAHLEKASHRINGNDYAGAIRESIHAVESAARTLDPRASTTLTPALKALEKSGRLHPALREAMSKLYGYTSNEEGIRHALLEKREADVGSEEAVFMFGACAVFCGYLASKRAGSKRK